MTWLTFTGYLVMLGTLLWLPEISRKIARVVLAHRPVRARGVRVRRASHLTPRPLRSDLSDPMFWVGHGGAVRKWK